jgi:hypothetical protein
LGIAVFHFPAALIVAGTAALAGGTYVLSREIYRAVVSNRHNRLRGLLERLVEVCEESAR